MSYPNKPQNDGDVDITWEWPEDDLVTKPLGSPDLGEYGLNV